MTTRPCAGGGIYCESSSAAIENNIITANIGGGIYLYYSPAQILNNTIVSNSGGNEYTAGYLAFGAGGILCYGSSPTIANNVVAFNASGISFFGEDGPAFGNNCVYGNTSFDYIGVTDPTGTNGNISVDPGLANYQYGNIHIVPDSPCRDAGNTDWQYAMSWGADIDSQGRVRGLSMDIGADESFGETPSSGPNVIVRVTPEGDDGNDGSSWTLSKQTVQAAIDAASAQGGEVWVKSGTYNEQITVRPYAYVYGGFAGTETARSQRDWISNQSILDAEQNGRVVDIATAHMMGTIDGFTIRNGRSTSGAGIMCSLSSAPITNNSITGNAALVENAAGGRGGGVAVGWSTAPITNNVITGNTAARQGAGLLVNLASSTISGNTIAENTVDLANTNGSGGGILLGEGVTGEVTNNLLVGNAAVLGGGMGLTAGSCPSVLNNTFVGNSASAIRAYLSSATIANNVIAFNGCGLYFDECSITPRYNDVYENRDSGGILRNYVGVNPGPGSISADPLFVDLEGGDYHVLSGSPCTDTGTSDGAPVTDKDDNPRPYDGDGDGYAYFDIGAYEYR